MRTSGNNNRVGNKSLFFFTLLVACLVCGGAVAESDRASLDEDAIRALYDTNGDGVWSLEEYQVFALHVVSPELQGIDTNRDGKISPEEAQAVVNAARARLVKEASISVLSDVENALVDSNGNLVGPVPKEDIPVSTFEAYDETYENTEKVLKNTCGLSNPDKSKTLQRLFVRRDRVDLDLYQFDISDSVKKGGAFTFSHDLNENTELADVDVAAAVVLFRDCFDGANPVSGLQAYSFAAYTDVEGTLNPSDKEDEKSNVRFGLDAKLELAGPKSVYHNVAAGPYALTDLRGKAAGYGMEVSYAPVNANWYMGGGPHQSRYLGAYWTPFLSADFMKINAVGKTGYADKSEAAWLGGDLGVTLYLLPVDLEKRLYGKANFTYFWDAFDLDIARNYSAEIGYDLDKKGHTSISLEYRNGNTKEDPVKQEAVKLNLNFKH